MIGDTIRAEFDNRGWSYRDAAARIPYTASDISRWISGERAPTLEACAWLAAAFSGERPDGLVSMDDLPVAKANGAMPPAWRDWFVRLSVETLADNGTRPRKAAAEDAA